jgi:hypothetical protein
MVHCNKNPVIQITLCCFLWYVIMVISFAKHIVGRRVSTAGLRATFDPTPPVTRPAIYLVTCTSYCKLIYIILSEGI